MPGGGIDMPLTHFSLTEDTILDLGAAQSATFGDLIPGSGTFMLRITGEDYTAVFDLADYWDTDPGHAYRNMVSIIDTDGTSYVDLEVIPEPASAAILLLGLPLLIRRRRKR